MDLADSGARDQDNLGEKGTCTLRTLILSGELKPRQRLREIPLADLLSTSRSTARAALQRLQSEGLVILKSPGWQVRELTNDDFLELCSLRENLEWMACRLVASTMDSRKSALLQSKCHEVSRAVLADDLYGFFRSSLALHLCMVELSGHGHLLEHYVLIANQLLICPDLKLSDGMNLQSLFAEEVGLIRALIAGDCENATVAVNKYFAAWSIAWVLLTGSVEAHT